MHYKLALLGFGNVGRELARLLMRKEAELKARYDIIFTITGIATGRHGTAINPDGLDLARVLAALESGQSLGIAETDPSADVDGWDAAVKVAALVTVLMDTPLKPQQVERKGIREISPEKIAAAKGENKRWKLACSARREGGSVTARVWPELLLPNSPMYNIDGTTSLVEFETDVLGLLSIVETDPGPATTAYRVGAAHGLLADFINAVHSRRPPCG